MDDRTINSTFSFVFWSLPTPEWNICLISCNLKNVHKLVANFTSLAGEAIFPPKQKFVATPMLPGILYRKDANYLYSAGLIYC